LKEVALPEIGVRRWASTVISDIRAVVEREMAASRAEISKAVTELLVKEIRQGTQAIKKVVSDEAAAVRDELSDFAGNAYGATEEAAAAAAEAEAVAAKNGGGGA
jgi:flagellar biosynthesis/type III secretory pathway protein FliH